MFDLRLRQYVPGGAAGSIITTLTIDANPLDSDMSTLSFKVSDVVFGALPDYLEVGLEYWDGSAWTEFRNGRFLANIQDIDPVDPVGVRTVTAVNYWMWLFGKTSLKGVIPYGESGKTATHDPGITGGSSLGTTVTKTAHGFIDGDAIVLTSKPAKMKSLATNVVYYADATTADTFKVRGSRDGGAKNLGKWSPLSFRRTDDKISSSGSQFVNNDLVTFTDVGTSPTLHTDASYRVVQMSSTSYGVSNEVGGDPIDIVADSGGSVGSLALFREMDGDRQLAGTPGVILKTVIDEAQARGWAAGLSYDFTTTHDSAGVSWANAQPLQFSPGTTGKAILDRLVEMGACEYSTDGRTLRLWNPDHGTDLSLGANPVRVGLTASATPVKSNLDQLVTDLTVQGEGRILLDLHSASAPDDLGRLEAFQSLSGIVDSSTASLLGTNFNKTTNRIARQYTVTENAAATQSLPGIDYLPGDWVKVRVGAAWLALRVVELVLSKDTEGVVTVSLVLNTRFLALLARIARKRAAATGGVSIGGTGTTRPGQDHRLPKAPTGLVAQSMGGWNADGAAFTTITGSWGVVTEATDSTAIDVASYEMWVREDGESKSVRAAAGRGTSMSKGPFNPNTDHYVKVRAKSSAGLFGPFTAEVEISTAVLLEPLDPTTAPTVTSKLGTVKVTWDGLLINSDAETYSPPPEFAYAWVGMSTTELGVYTPVGQNLGLAGGSTITGLTLGDVRWFKLYAVDRLTVASPASAAVSVTVVGVKGPDIEANSVTANSIAAGAIQAEHLSLGAVLPTGGPQNRVPAPLTDTTYWPLVIDGTISLNYTVLGTVADGTGGITATSTGTVRAAMAVTVLRPIPASGKISVSYAASTSGALKIAWYDAAGASVRSDLSTLATGMDEFTTPAGATQYRVMVNRDAGSSPAVATVAACSVFEVIGGGAGQQSAELSPAGLRLVSDDGSGVIDLTTASDNFFSIMKWTGVGYESQAAIDSDGGAQFTSASVNTDIEVRGTPLLGDFDTILRNGAEDTAGSIFEMKASGVILAAYYYWPADGTYTAAYQAFAYGSVDVVTGRRYQLSIDTTVAAASVAAGTAHFEVLLSNAAISVSATSGYTVLKDTTLNSADGSKAQLFDLNRPMGIDTAVGVNDFVAGKNYILIRLRNTSGSDPYINFGIGSGTIAVNDVGPAYLDSINFTNNATSGAQTAPTSSVTTTWNCSWSRSWNGGGSSIVSGTGQYTDANMLYQGLGVSSMGARAGWPALGISGKTITSCKLWLQNRHTYSSGGVTAHFGSGSDTSAPSTFGSRVNAWDVHFNKGEGKWIDVPSSLWASIASGAIRSFSLGVSSTAGDYAYFDGNTKSSEPKIKITYK